MATEEALLPRTRLQAIKSCLVKKKYVWRVIIGVTLLVLAVIWCLCSTLEQWLRLVGLWLQLLGIGTVWWGIAKTRKLFGHPSFLSKLMELVTRPHPPTQIVSGVTVPGEAAVSSSGIQVKNELGPRSPTGEERLSSLEKDAKGDRKRLDHIESELSNRIQKMEGLLRNEEQSRLTAVKRLRKLLKETAAGGLHISAIGACLLFVGVILSTASPELTQGVTKVAECLQ